MDPLFVRPLALAGLSAVAGVLLGENAPPVATATILLAAALLAIRVKALLPGAAALLAGAVAAHRAPRDSPALPRAPPRTATCSLSVLDCGEDPFGDRAWLVGHTRDGTGVLATWPGPAPAWLAPGARVEIAGRFFRPRAAGNPGEQDPRARLAKRGLAWRADLRLRQNLTLSEAAPRGPRRLLALLRRRAARRLARRLPPDVGPVAAALLLGVRSGISRADRERFERTGTLHLLAISGMHLLLLAGAVHALLRLGGVGPRVAAGLTLALALAYVPLAGSGPPIRRAVTMLVFYAAALIRGRPPDAASSLGGAMLLIALTDPHDVSRVGFRLSFAAAAGIALLAGRWRACWGRRHRLLARFPAVRHDIPVRLFLTGQLLGALPVAVAAWCATQALVADSFGIVTPYAPLINLAAAPFVALLLPLTALFTLGLDACGGAITLLTRALRGLLGFAATWPGGTWLVAPPMAAVVLWCGGTLLLRWRPRPALALLGLAAATTAAAATSRDRTPTLRLFDVGQGQALLLRFDDGALVLVDAGSSTRPDLARRVLLPAFRALGVRRLRALVCTHADADHWNAIPALLRHVDVDRILVPEPVPPLLRAIADERQIPIVVPRPGMLVHSAGWTRLVVLAVGGPASANDGSIALRFEAGPRAALLPADRQEAGIQELLGAPGLRADLLIAPHHGARCANAAPFGRRVRAPWLLVSAARGRADSPTMEAYGAQHTLKTWRQGSIEVRFTAAGALQIESFR